MFWKLIVLIVSVTAIGAALLALRQQRMETVHQTAVAHQTMEQSRRAIWQWQVQVTDRTEPRALQQAIARAGLALEPIVPVPEKRPERPNVRVASQVRRTR